MRQTLKVDVQNYNIIISNDSISDLMNELIDFTEGQRRLFVVSKKVYRLYKNEFEFDKYDLLVLNDGEKEKNFKNYIKIIEKAEKIGLTRKDVIIALGGGVIGDITGFAAATYMRGIDYIQVPTTLLSMVDSSVGGKTAIDMKDAKNIVGAFFQPKQVFININFLKTLDKRQFNSGLGEVLKYAFIEDSCGYKHPLYLFEYLTLCNDKILNQDSISLMRVIEFCLKLKIAVVNSDEKETGLRKILNLGHTYGHAIEVLGKYKKILHGEAVIQGLFFIFNYAYAQGIINYSYYRLSNELLGKYGFKSKHLKYAAEKILAIMKKDKKAKQGKITFILPSDKKQVMEKQLTYDEVLGLL
ncbi:3-dehydroquinate synthase [bacterium]|nr:3-dehydroquinate synthase [bacterium]